MKKKTLLLIALGSGLLLCLVLAYSFHEHRFGEWYIDLAPSCAEKGIEERRCFCGKSERRDIAPSSEHIYGDWSACRYYICPATKKDERLCSVCGTKETRPSAVQGEHIYDDVRVIKNADCEVSGEIRSYCKCQEYKTEIIPAAHVIITEEAVFPTQTQEGYTKGVYCSYCDKVWQERKTVGRLTYSDMEMLTALGYEGDPKTGINLKYKLTDQGAAVIFGFIAEVSSESIKQEYTFFAHDGDMAVDMLSQSGKYTVKVYPVDENGRKTNPKTVEVNWYPEISELGFPRVEITTLDGELPTYTRVDHPEGSWGIGITDNEYVQSIVSIYDGDDKLLYRSSESDFGEAKIRVRGNTSALGRKHPFKIKLKHKEDLLSGLVDRNDGADYRARDWVLLSEGKKFSYVTGSAIADLVGCEWTPEYCYVALFVNGDYRGLYILIESVDQGEERCDVSDEGYIVEMDSYWWNDELYFTTPISEGSAVKPTFKYPDSDNLSETSAQYLYIKEYMTKMEQTLLSGGDAQAYIDYESAAKWLLVHDILGTYDSGGANMYMTKYDSTQNSKLVFGPLWDYGTVYSYEPDRFARIRSGKFFYMYLLIEDEAFMTLYKERYKEIREKITDTVQSALSEYDNEVFDTLLSYETKRWNSEITTAKEETELSINWMTEHLDWMDDNL